jgi:hypothetical protein
MFFASSSPFFIQFSAHRRFLLVGAIDPAVDPGRLCFHACGIRPKPEQVAADVHRARREIGRGCLLRFVKQTLPVRARRLRKSDLHHVQIFAQFLNGLGRSGSLDCLVRRQMVLLGDSKKPRHGEGRMHHPSPCQMFPLPYRRSDASDALSSAFSIRRRPHIRRR